VKAGLQDRLTGSQPIRVAPDTGPMTGSSNYQQPPRFGGRPTEGVRDWRWDRKEWADAWQS
jgi:hypothetical protein